jgi:ATPase subunit of ABC transporter with duplicated ATPase domains
MTQRVRPKGSTESRPVAGGRRTVAGRSSTALVNLDDHPLALAVSRDGKRVLVTLPYDVWIVSAQTLEVERTILEHMRSAAPEQTDTDLRKILGAFLFTGDDVDKPAGVLSGGEKTRLALATLVCSGANVLLLDEPTNNLDPVSREQVLDAIARYPGAIVLVTHDPGAVQALKPDRAILLPDGVEDAWSDDLLELVELA